MRLTFFSFMSLLLLISCQENYIPRMDLSVKIERFDFEKNSIRAIEILNDTSIVFAGSDGRVGMINNIGQQFNSVTLKKDTLTPHFRALSINNETVFALNIASPALLYKIQNGTQSIVYKEAHEKAFYDAMEFFDEMNGIAMGDPTDGCLSIIVTRDGGKSWFKIPCDQLPQGIEGEAAFAASDTNIAIYGKNVWIATGGMAARIYHSSDMGTSWNVYPTPIIQGKATTGIYSVDFYDENTGIICGGDFTDKFGDSANKAITNDGGKTWTLVGEHDLPKYVSCVQYIPDTDGKEVLAVSTNGIFYSNSSGQTWKKISDDGFYSIRIANRNEAWLSGNEVIGFMRIE